MKIARKAWMIAALAGGAAACTPAAEPMDTMDPSVAPADTFMTADTMTTLPTDTPRVEMR